VHAGSQILPAVSHIACSPCGRYLAVAGSAGISTYLIESSSSHKCLASLPRSSGSAGLGRLGHKNPQIFHDGAVITALQFSGDGELLAVASTEVPLQLLSVHTLVAEGWLASHHGLQQKLDALEGHIESLAWQPGSQSGAGSLIVASKRMFCWVCLDQVKAGAAVGGWGIEKEMRKATKAAFLGDPVGSTARMLLFEGVGLGVHWLCAGQVLLVEARKERWVQHLPAPLALKKYGE
jgi:hypothetical protein